MELQEAELRNHIDPYSEGGLNSKLHAVWDGEGNPSPWLYPKAK
jgi:hypothetical protein